MPKHTRRDTEHVLSGGIIPVKTIVKLAGQGTRVHIWVRDWGGTTTVGEWRVRGTTLVDNRKLTWGEFSTRVRRTSGHPLGPIIEARWST